MPFLVLLEQSAVVNSSGPQRLWWCLRRFLYSQLLKWERQLLLRSHLPLAAVHWCVHPVSSAPYGCLHVWRRGNRRDGTGLHERMWFNDVMTRETVDVPGRAATLSRELIAEKSTRTSCRFRHRSCCRDQL